MTDLTPERLERLRANATSVQQAGYDHVNVNPDVVTGLLDEIERLRSALDEERSILALLVHDPKRVTAARALLNAPVSFKRDPEPAPEPAPEPTDRGIDLMAALEQSVAAAKEAWLRHLATGDRVRHQSKAGLGEGVVRGRQQGLIRVQWDDRSSDDLYPPDQLERLP